MENNYETLRMPELKALTRGRGLTNYSQLRKAELIALIQNNEHQVRSAEGAGPLAPSVGEVQAQRQQRPTQRHTSALEGPGAPPPVPSSRMSSTWEPNQPPQMSTWEPQRELEQLEMEVPLTKRQLKCRCAKDSKLAKKFNNLEAEYNNLKSQMDALEDKITKASKSTNARFKRKKIRSMKREADKITRRLLESKKALKSLEPRVPKDPTLKRHPPSRSKCIEAKITDLNKKIRRAKNKRNKECLIAKREALRWGPKQLEEVFGGAYRCYWIDGIEGMDVGMHFARTRKFLIDSLTRETRDRVICSKVTTWIRFVKDGAP